MSGITASPNWRQDGIRTVEDLRGRCRIDDETGCWLWAGAKRASAPSVWIPGHGACAMPKAIALLTGKTLERKRVMVPTCGRVDCANPAHRKEGSYSELWKLLRPSLTPKHRAKITAATRLALGKITPEIAEQIRAAEGSNAAVGARFGIHETQTSRIRRGDAWAALPGSSVFAMGGL